MVPTVISPALAIWKQNPDDTSILAMSVWPPPLNPKIEFVQTIVPPDEDLLAIQPGVGIAVDVGSDSEGTIHVGVLLQPSALLLSHWPEDPSDVWSSRQVSDPSHIVDQLALGVNVNNNTAVGYVNNETAVGQVWVARNQNAPERVSDPSKNSRDVDIAISNDVQIAEVHVAGVSPLKGGLDDLYHYNYIDGFRSNGDESLGEIYLNIYNPLTDTWQEALVSPGPAALPQVAMSALGNISLVWKLKEGNNWKIQGTRSSYDPISQSWDLTFTIRDISITGLVDQPRVVVDSLDINTIFAWKEWDGFNWRINASWYNGYQLWATWTFTTTYLSPVGFDADNLSVDMDSAGNAIVVWELFDGVDTRIQAARFDNQSKLWALPFTTRAMPQYISPAGATLPNIALANQSAGIVAYNLGQETFYNFWNANNQTFEPATNTNFPSAQLVSPLCFADYNGSQMGVVNTLVVSTRQTSTQNIWVTLPGSRDGKPASPTNVRGMQELHRFPFQADLINVIRWQPGDDTAVRYEIYVDPNRTKHVGTIPLHCPLVFCHHCAKPDEIYSYYLFAVNDQGVYSDSVKVVIPGR